MAGRSSQKGPGKLTPFKNKQRSAVGQVAPDTPNSPSVEAVNRSKGHNRSPRRERLRDQRSASPHKDRQPRSHNSERHRQSWEQLKKARQQNRVVDSMENQTVPVASDADITDPSDEEDSGNDPTPAAEDENESTLHINVPKSKVKTVDHLLQTVLHQGMVAVILDWSKLELTIH